MKQLSLWLAIGVGIGAALGVVLKNPAGGIGVGMAIGIALSIAAGRGRPGRCAAPKKWDGDDHSESKEQGN